MKSLQQYYNMGLQLVRWILNGGLQGKSPLFLGFMITYDCNLRCLYCVYPYKKEDEHVALDKAKEFIFYLWKKGLLRIGISGGEALLRKDFLLEILKYSRGIGLFTSLNTNGFYLKDNLDVLTYLNEIVFSLDGPKEIHDKIRGAGTFSKTLEGINEAKNFNLKINIVCVLSKLNINCISEIIDICKSLNVQLFFQPVVNLAGKNNASAIMLDDPVLKSLSLILLEYKKKYPLIIGNTKSFLKIISKQNINKNFKCKAGKLFTFLGPNGDVYPCCTYSHIFPSKNISGDFSNAIKNCQNFNCPQECYVTPFREMDFLGKYNIESIFNGLKHISFYN